MKIYNYLLITGFFLSMIQIAYGNYNPERNFYDPFAEDFILVQDTIPPLEDRPGNFSEGSTYNPFDLKDPSIIEQNVEYDPATGQYIISETIGDDYFRMPRCRDCLKESIVNLLDVCIQDSVINITFGAMYLI